MVNSLRNRRIIAVVLFLVALFICYVQFYKLTVAQNFPLGLDARAYIAASKAIQQNIDPYDLGVIGTYYDAFITKYIYPPVLALVLTPIAQLDLFTASYVVVILSFLSVLLFFMVISRYMSYKIAMIAIFLWPVTWQTIYLGQVNFLIALFVFLVIVLTEKGEYLKSGILLSLGFLIKITPVLLLYIFLRDRQWKGILSFGLTCALAVIVSLLWVDISTWVKGLTEAATSTAVFPYLTSWSALVAIWFPPYGEMIGDVITAFFIAVTFLQIRHVERYQAISALVFLPLLCARIVWSHHAVMALPALFLFWKGKPYERHIAIFTWLLVLLFTEWGLLIGISIAWFASCWPKQTQTFYNKITTGILQNRINQFMLRFIYNNNSME